MREIGAFGLTSKQPSATFVSAGLQCLRLAIPVRMVRYGTWYEANVIATNAKSVKMHFEGREGRYGMLLHGWDLTRILAQQ